MAIKIENDFLNNGHPDSRDPQFRWNGTTGKLPKPLSNEALAALRASAPPKPKSWRERIDEALAAHAKKVQ
ncbi:MAG: hypothetical protein ACLQJF_16165 [Candidatus Sulfotelmatobacter sp.]